MQLGGLKMSYRTWLLTKQKTVQVQSSCLWQSRPGRVEKITKAKDTSYFWKAI